MSRVDLGLTANALLVLATGYGLLYGLGLVRSGASALRLAGAGYLLGWALLGSVLALGLVAGLAPSVLTVTIVAAISVSVGILVGRRRPDPIEPSRPSERHPLALLAAALGTAQLALVSLSAIALSVEGTGYGDYIDNLVFWIPKAASIYYADGLDADALASLRHPEYPPLVPAMNAATFHFAGGFHPSVLPFQMTLLGVAFLLAVAGLLDRVAPRWVTLPTLALLATTPWFWWRLQSPLADQPVAYLIAVAVASCVLWLRDLRGRWLAVAFVALLAATLTKLEGSMLAVLLLAVTLAAGVLVHRRAGLAAAWLALAPVAVLPWQLWLEHGGLPRSAEDYDATDLLRPGLLADRADRLRRTVDWMLEAPFHQTQTAVLVCAVVAGLAVAALRVPVPTATVAAWLVLASAGLASVYWIGELEIDFYLSSSLSRVGATIIVTAAVVMPLLVGLALERGEPADGVRAGP
jgi:hypothetical protein